MEISPRIYERRRKRLFQKMIQSRIDALIITDWNNLFYLTGLQPMQARSRLNEPMPLLIFAESETFSFVPNASYYPAVKAEHKEIRDVQPYDSTWDAVAKKTLWDVVANRIDQHETEGKIGLEYKSITHGQALSATRRFRQKRLFDCSGFVEELRMIKGREEVSILREAGRITHRVTHEILGELQPGKSEMDVAREVISLSTRLGAETTSFHPQVVSGRRTTLLGNLVSSPTKKLEKGEIVLVDFGVYLRGYNTDITITTALGRVESKEKAVASKVAKIVRSAVSQVRPGVRASKVHAAALKTFDRLGYGGYCRHYTGHGLGLSVWDRPFFVEYDDTIIREGMVFSVEQGIYLDNWGIRMEDNVVVTADGNESLTNTPLELLQVSTS